jgi:DNA replication licensing factor MCM2
VNEVTEDRIPQAVLRKYIKYARTKCTPRLQHVDVEKLTATYIELRREAAVCICTICPGLY